MSEQWYEHLPEPLPLQHSLECSTKHSDLAIFSETHSLVFSEKVKSEKIQQALTQWVKEIRDWSKDKAYLVGHIKVFVEGQENLWLSSTGRSINIKHSQGWNEWTTDRVTLNLTAIIFGTSRKALEEAAQERLKACFLELNCTNEANSL